jgi:teichuronic acid biosynthesis glycosyltransferase TuaH
MYLIDPSDWMPGARSVLYLTDDLPAGSEYLGVSHRHLVAAERRAVLAADVVVCVSDVIADRVSAMRRDVHVIPNGCNMDVFEQLPNGALDLGLPAGRVVGLAGNLNQRIDWDIVEAIAAADINVLLVGPVLEGVDRARFDAICSRPNVCWTGQVEHSDLPAYLAAIDVGITPYVDNDFNRASFPLKTLEYLAAGLDVVSSDLPAVRWLDTDLIRVASSPGQFVQVVRAALAEEPTQEIVSRRRSFARAHTWRSRVDDLLAVIHA